MKKGEKVEKTKTKSRHEGRLGESSSTAGSMMPPGRREEERIRKENAKATAKLSLAPAYHHETTASPSTVSSEQPNNDDESKTKEKETTASKAAAKRESKTTRKSKTKAKETTASKAHAKRESRTSRKSKTKTKEATASKDAKRESRTSGKSSSTWRERRELEDDASGVEDVVMEEDDEDTRPGATSVVGSSITRTTNEIDEELGHHHRKPSTFSTSINDDTIAEEEGTMSEKGISDGGGGASLKPFTVEATLVEEGMRPEDREQIEKEIRNELLDNVVVGEAMIVDDDSKRTSSLSSKKCWLVIFLAVILLIIGIVVGIVVGKNGGQDKEEDNKAETEPPTATEPIPTIDISTPSPTTSPTLPEPTWSPTISIENLDNGNITEAHPLVLRGTTPLEDSGSNFQFQEYSGTSAACDLRRKDRRDLATRDLAVWFARTYGLWYIYRARTSGPVTAVLCGSNGFNGYDLELFSGEGRHTVCSTMENGDLGNCGGTSVSWIAQEGLSYYVLAHEYDNVIFEPYSIEIVDNDKCQFAFGPITPTSVGVVMSYSTTNAEIDTEVNDSSCGGASAGGGPGVWYLVEGTGRPLTASTCSDGTTFDTQISVFGGTLRAPCENLTCINGNNDFCGKASSVTWPSQIGEVYYVLVQGATIDDVGDFELTISTDADRIDNDFCATAEVLGTDEVSFSFSGSTADDVPVCSNEAGSWNSDLEPGQQENLPYGLWYSFVGDGSDFGYEVYVPDEAPIVVKVLSPVSSGCGDLACVEEAEFRSWGVVGYSYHGHCIPTVPGQIYYIFLATRHSENIDAIHSITITGCL